MGSTKVYTESRTNVMHTQKKMDVFRSKSIFRFGLYASLFGFLEVTAALMILIYAKTRVRDGQFADTWRDTALIDTWLSLNSAIHILLGAIVSKELPP